MLLIVSLKRRKSDVTAFHAFRHMLTPRWTHAIDVRAEARHEDSLTFSALGWCLLAVLRDQAVPMAPVPMADVPRSSPPRRPEPSRPQPNPAPLHVPQEIESVPQQEAGEFAAAPSNRSDY
jgi:hypothetical protein